jgi:hypothetical protein
MKWIKLILINIFILLLLFFTVFGLLNILLGGVPQYNLFSLSEEEVLNQKKIYFWKKNIFYPDKTYRDYFKNYYSDEYFKVYKEKGYTGFFKKEPGVDINQIYQTDMFGNRENSDFYYSKVDVVLLGDSYLSVAINEPFDLTSNLRKLTNLTFLNLGKNGSGPSSQYQRLKYLTKNTEFNTVFIFFYEGNDHQEIHTIDLETDLSIDHNINRNYFSNYNISDFKVKEYNKNYFILFKIFLSEYFRGFSTFFTYFKNYPELLNKRDYDKVCLYTKNFLDSKAVKNKYIYYIPKYTRHALIKAQNHPQIKQLDNLKKDVKIIAELNDFIFIDGDDAFKGIDHVLDVYHYRYPTHFNSYGYRLMSEHIKKILDEQTY